MLRRLFPVAAAAAILVATPAFGAELKPPAFEALRAPVMVRKPRISPNGSSVGHGGPPVAERGPDR